MTRRLAGVVFLAALAGAGCGGGLGWKEVSSADGRFKVQMPAEPAKLSAAEEPPVGPITLTTYTVKHEGDGFFVGWADLPPKPPFQTEDLLKGIAKRYEAEVKSSKEITLQDNPGREFDLETAKGRKLVGRLYVVKDRLYELLVIGDGGKAPSAEKAQQFFGSFQLIDPLMK
jgi:hypothetical protein